MARLVEVGVAARPLHVQLVIIRDDSRIDATRGPGQSANQRAWTCAALLSRAPVPSVAGPARIVSTMTAVPRASTTTSASPVLPLSGWFGTRDAPESDLWPARDQRNRKARRISRIPGITELVRTPGVVREALFFRAGSGENGVVVFNSMCNRPRGLCRTRLDDQPSAT